MVEHMKGMQNFEGWYLLEVGAIPTVYSKKREFLDMLAKYLQQQGRQVRVVYKKKELVSA